MAFVKVVKNKAYFKRYQVKYRRRREGKTDYYARRKLVRQDKNKYNTPKYRLCVRFTNKDVICQVAYATIEGDRIICAAYSHELPRYGVKVGLTNWAACYATGLLLARRLLTKYNLADKYEGNTNGGLTEDDELYHVEENVEGPRPFRCFLDVGLARTSTGAKIFGAMKGAVDGGLDIPHNEKRFPAWSKDTPEEYVEFLKRYVYGGHVADFMEELEEEDEDKYKVQFARYIAEDISFDDLEDMYKECHEAIRADPSPKEKSKPFEGQKHKNHRKKLTYAQRKNRVQQIQQTFLASQEE
ncbi:60S ribosomal protein L5 [Sphaeroforma arctica JP610]|uniref:60S ribosomal protein L5 n=1 Tax=Sphaeroforma arctica JP610 TaxID=667725 RepID=A0A0L0G6E2_9EUKA|nr:60S ribosomal protein L5 [Sphaeroforma arctica JP610]KNC84524.1 60S ribosomal protein L5 [Sphaeroforma arctica JP610]|eukprot:XP_014158426.1 60S ribosomal protein L5 [Sphaeroforma arctica JP610]